PTPPPPLHDALPIFLPSLYKRAFADSTKILFIFSVGIKSVRRLIRSSPTRTIGLGLAFPLFTITLTSPVPMPAKTLLVFGMSTRSEEHTSELQSPDH